MPNYSEKDNIMTPLERVKQIVSIAKGDNLERAEIAFRGMTIKQLTAPYGASGQSCQEILDGYRQQRQDWQDAFDFVNTL